MYLSNKASAYK